MLIATRSMPTRRKEIMNAIPTFCLYAMACVALIYGTTLEYAVFFVGGVLNSTLNRISKS